MIDRDLQRAADALLSPIAQPHPPRISGGPYMDPHIVLDLLRALKRHPQFFQDGAKEDLLKALWESLE